MKNKIPAFFVITLDSRNPYDRRLVREAGIKSLWIGDNMKVNIPYWNRGKKRSKAALVRQMGKWLGDEERFLIKVPAITKKWSLPRKAKGSTNHLCPNRIR